MLKRKEKKKKRGGSKRAKEKPVANVIKAELPGKRKHLGLGRWLWVQDGPKPKPGTST